MNLTESIKWLNGQIEELEKANANMKQIKVYKKFLFWLDDLLKYRLMFSEIRGEFSYTDNATFSTDYLLNFLDEELKEWNLDNKKYDE